MAGRWSRLFPAGDFRWSIGLRPGDPRAFFARTPEHDDLIAERAHWLNEKPDECALLTEDGVPLLHEAATVAAEWDPEFQPLPINTLHHLGRNWEPDFVLLSMHDDEFIVEGGVVCFPSSWSLREKLGRTLDFTHSIVPELNAQLGSRIQKALAQLAPCAAWERENWGLSRDAERNHFAHRPRRALDRGVTPEEVWLRIERQVVLKLPNTGGVLFGIRLEILPWREVVSDADAREGLRSALISMPEEAARYKGLSDVRHVLANWLA